MKKFIIIGCAVFIPVKKIIDDNGWKTNKKYDLSIPILGEDGWYMVFEDDFDGDFLNQNIQFGEKKDYQK